MPPIASEGKLIRNTYLKHYYQLIITPKVYRASDLVKFDSETPI